MSSATKASFGLQIGAQQQGKGAAPHHQQQHTQQHGPKADASLGAEHGLTLLGVGELGLDAASASR